jgi:hypothetical protein
MAVNVHTVGASFFIAVGVWLVLYYVWCVWQSLRSREWPQVAGTIVVSDLQRQRDIEGAHTYRAQISYSYSVNGREFIGARAQFGNVLAVNFSAPAVRLHRRYPAGSPVRVKYAPTDPNESVLESAVAAPVTMSFFFGLVLLVIGLAMVAAF